MPGTEHETITSAGWTYRMNERGWVIYREPTTGVWYTRTDAMAIVDSQPRRNSRDEHFEGVRP